MLPKSLIRSTIAALRLSRTVTASVNLNSVVANRHAVITHNTTGFQRLYSAQPSSDPLTVDYDYVKKATSDSKILIVDVREPDEIKEHGKIPNSINIPLGNVSSVLSTMSDKEFQEAHNRRKPSEDTQIIFYCMLGRRAGLAQKSAIELGYKNTKNYMGSWTEWASKAQ